MNRFCKSIVASRTGMAPPIPDIAASADLSLFNRLPILIHSPPLTWSKGDARRRCSNTNRCTQAFAKSNAALAMALVSYGDAAGATGSENLSSTLQEMRRQGTNKEGRQLGAASSFTLVERL